MCDSLELVYTYDGILPVPAWEVIWKLLSEEHATDGTFEVYEHVTTGQDVLSLLERSRKMHFSIHCEACDLHLGAVGNHNLSLLTIEWSQPREISEWGKWMDVLCRRDSFISGRLYNSEYEKWQNAKDPLQYEAAGRSYDHLPMKSNELPPPLQRQVIDTSKNPGRRVLQNGYVEAVAAVMWLGPLFMKRTGADVSSLRAVASVSILDQSLGILECVAGSKCFSRADGEEAALQCALRERLFPVWSSDVAGT